MMELHVSNVQSTSVDTCSLHSVYKMATYLSAFFYSSYGSKQINRKKHTHTCIIFTAVFHTNESYLAVPRFPSYAWLKQKL